MKFKSYYLEKVMMQKHPLPSQSDYFVLKKCFQGFYFNLVLRFHFIIWRSENYYSPFVNYLCQKPFRGKEIFNNFFKVQIWVFWEQKVFFTVFGWYFSLWVRTHWPAYLCRAGIKKLNVANILSTKV